MLDIRVLLVPLRARVRARSSRRTSHHRVTAASSHASANRSSRGEHHLRPGLRAHVPPDADEAAHPGRGPRRAPRPAGARMLPFAAAQALSDCSSSTRGRCASRAPTAAAVLGRSAARRPSRRTARCPGPAQPRQVPATSERTTHVGHQHLDVGPSRAGHDEPERRTHHLDDRKASTRIGRGKRGLERLAPPRGLAEPAPTGLHRREAGGRWATLRRGPPRRPRCSRVTATGTSGRRRRPRRASSSRPRAPCPRRSSGGPRGTAAGGSHAPPRRAAARWPSGRASPRAPPCGSPALDGSRPRRRARSPPEACRRAGGPSGASHREATPRGSRIDRLAAE